MKAHSTFLWSAVISGVLGMGAGGLMFGHALAVPPSVATQTDPAQPLPIPPVPPRLAEGEEYEHCLDMLTTDPAGANAFAEAWQATGGGDGAQHCLGLSQIALGDPDAGAAQLERVASTSHAPALARAIVFDQAAQAWLMAGDAARAYAASTLALTLSPDDPDLLVDRSIAAATEERYSDAITDLDQALLIDPRRADALVYRGAAHRQLEQIDLATSDIDRALLLDPDNADALLERGILRQRQGNRDGARADWERAIALAPDTATGDLAQQNLALLEAGPSTQ
jgi:tetratricopeptide (TPR) repeat protein